eukprot:229537_1
MEDSVFGFWQGLSGQAYEYNAWITDGATDHFGSEWVLSAQQRDLYRGNGIDLTVNPTGTFQVTQTLDINKGFKPEKSSDWACTEIIIINQKIPLDDIICIENYLLEKYRTNAPTSAPTLPPVAFAWFFVDYSSGTPARCSATPGWIECASDDGINCKWGTYTPVPAYQVMSGVTATNPRAEPCAPAPAPWPSSGGLNNCEVLGCQTESHWYFLKHPNGQGTPVRCSSTYGMIECAADDGVNCKWNDYDAEGWSLFQKMSGVSGTIPRVQACPAWDTITSEDACLQLGCWTALSLDPWTVSSITLPTPKSSQMAYFDSRTELLWLIGGWDLVTHVAGYDTGVFDVYTLNMTSEVWTTHTPLPRRLTTEAYQWTVIQHTFYAFVSNQTITYDIDTEEFKIENITPPLPAVSWDNQWSIYTKSGCVTSYNAQYVIIVGGSNTKHLQMYDLGTSQWLSSLPSTIQVHGSGECVTHNDHLYMIGGVDEISTYLNTVEKINLSTLSQWDALSDTLSQPIAYMSAIAVSNVIYVIGGYTGTAVSNRVQMISTLDDSITTTTVMNYALSRVTLAKTPRNEIIALGGRDDAGSDYVIDAIQISVVCLQLGCWTALSLDPWTVSSITLPTPKSSQMAYFDSRTELLWLIGGWDAVNSGGSFDVYTLNMTSDVWTAHTPLPNRLKTEPYQWTIVQNTFYAFVSNQTLSYDIDTEAFTIENIAPPLPASSGMGACITSYNTQYLIFVGSDTKQLQIYDFNTLQWLSNLPSTTKVRRGGTCVTANDHLFVIGGYDTIGSTYLSTIEKINLLTLSQWDTLSATLSQAKAFTGDIVIGDIIYVIGGYTGTAVSNRVQMISTLDDSITTTTTIDYSLRSVTLATTPRNEIIVLGGRDNQPSDSVIDAIQISVGIATFAPTFAPSNPTNAPSNAPTMPSIPPTMAPTAKLQWCVDTEVIDAWYDGDSIDIANDVWTDKSGYNHHGSIGVSTGIGVFNGTNETHELFTYMNKTAIYGATTTQITFNVDLHPINHTVFNYCKYRDVGVKRRILQTSTQNGVFGFWNGRSGQAVEGNWITDGSTDWFGSEWVISAQQTDLYRGNRIDKTSNPNNPFTVTQQLMIGLGAYGGETSDWACTEIIVIDQKIPLDDIICIENYLL